MRLPTTPRLHSSPIGVLPCLRCQTPDTSNAFNEILSLPEDSNGKIPHPTFPTNPGVENPYKNPSLLKSDGNTLKVDQAPPFPKYLRVKAKTPFVMPRRQCWTVCTPMCDVL
ncbi:hypothetical protein HJC23_002542 [Cyclotella cryptica]|uniref:Uncharacterized protein n=1 Tax=Cyclotella cryptica TaxID=29204 RepID=A0ABD3QWD9_9STRA